MTVLTPLQMPALPGGFEWAILLLLAVLLFGANKIPKLARSTGEAIGEFKKGRQEIEQELQEIQDPVEETAQESGSSTEQTDTDEEK